jgi:hypothetical protein
MSILGLRVPRAGKTKVSSLKILNHEITKLQFDQDRQSQGDLDHWFISGFQIP